MSLTVPVGQPATFTVGASGGSLSYQWQRDEANIGGATATTYTIPSAALSDNLARFRVIVSGPGGTAVSSSATLTVTGPSALPTAITAQPTPVTVAAGAPAIFTVSATGESLTYQWQRNGVDIPGATGAAYLLTTAGTVDHGSVFRVVVSGAGGVVASDAVALIVNQSGSPTAIIRSPQAGGLYTAGKAIKFKGIATDPQDGKLKPAALSWRVDFHHSGRVDTVVPATPGKAGGAFKVPQTGETATDVFYRIELTATDSGGLSTTAFQDVRPRTANITVNANRPGLVFHLDGVTTTTPTTFAAVVGSRRTFTADASQIVDGVNYAFGKWSKGKKPEFVLNVPAKGATVALTYA